jgi:hypothetical protein
MIIGLVFLNFHCDSEPSHLEGEWKLVERLIDPGDGSGVFEPVNSEKKIRFFKDGTLLSNGSLCNPGNAQTDQTSTGTYNAATGEMTINDCHVNPIQYSIDGPYLTVTYQCIEACRDKYLKISSNLVD